MKIEEARERGATVLAIKGKLTYEEGAPALRVRVWELVRAGTKDVILDLAGTTFVDSSGIEAILRAHVRTQEAGGSLLIRNPTRHLKRLLKMTHLADIFAIEKKPLAAYRSS